MEKRWRFLLIAGIAFLCSASFFAYIDLIPWQVRFMPFYDSIGHFILFGVVGLCAHYALRKRYTRVFGRSVPIGPVLAIIYACLDESLQVFSHNRSFDLGDLFFGVLGILVLVSTAWYIENRRSIDLRFYAIELYFFTLKEVRSILFPLLFIFLLFISNYINIPGIYRYDLLFIGAVLIQIGLILFKLETKREAKIIVLFHMIGLCLELFKTHPSVGSWSYPEEGYLKIADVPLYSGFMYAAVGSYIAHAWRVFKLRLDKHPGYKTSVVLCCCIYLNFFTNHFIHDMRMFLFAAIFIIFYRTDVYFTVRKKEYRMPLLVSFLLIGFFIWIAENMATFLGAWKYPGQIHVWEVVNTQKITSWFLLVIICFIVVASLKHFKKMSDG